MTNEEERLARRAWYVREAAKMQAKFEKDFPTVITAHEIYLQHIADEDCCEEQEVEETLENIEGRAAREEQKWLAKCERDRAATPGRSPAKSERLDEFNNPVRA